MSAPSTLLGRVDCSSVLRFGFANLQPISIKKTVQKWGLKLTTISWQLRSERRTDFIESYPTYVAFLNDSVMKKVKLPENIESHALAQAMTKRTIEQFEKDKELKSVLVKVEKEKDSAKPFLEFVRFLRKRFDEERAKTVQAKAEMFTSSNLPFSLFTNLVMSNEIFEGFLDVMHKKINLYESVWLYKFRNDPVRFKKKFQEMKDSLAPLFDVMELSSFSQKCLSTLIFAYNCANVESLSSTDFIDIKRIDYQQFEQLSAEFSSSLELCTSTILRMEPNSFSKLPRTELGKVFSQALV
jgi:hypothetical protein